MHAHTRAYTNIAYTHMHTRRTRKHTRIRTAHTYVQAQQAHIPKQPTYTYTLTHKLTHKHTNTQPTYIASCVSVCACVFAWSSLYTYAHTTFARVRGLTICQGVSYGITTSYECVHVFVASIA